VTDHSEGSALPPWCRRLLSELDAADRRAIALAKPLTPRELNWRSRPATWSIGQCVDHLRLTNDVYCPAISDSLSGRSPAVVDEITLGWFGGWFIRNYIEPSALTRRARAPRKVKPAVDADPFVLDRFLESNEAVRQVVRRAADYDVNRIRFRNPFLSVIHFTVGTGLEILLKHQQRHLLQAERVREASRSSSNGSAS
jgi:hypothetical protein